MWVRIDEVSFASDRADEVINNVRNSAVALHRGEGYLGFRLLVDRARDRALNVSYWQTEDDARADRLDPSMNPTGADATTLVTSHVYVLAIDAV